MRLKPNEEDVVKQIVQGLRVNGIAIFREIIPRFGSVTGSDRLEAGHPDLHGWFKRGPSFAPVPVYIEVKAPGRHKKRPAQIEFITRAKADGCIAFFAQGWDDVVREFHNFGITLPN